MAPPKLIVKAEDAPSSSKAQSITIFKPKGKFPFTRLPFEMQKEVFQYLLAAANDQIIRPEKSHQFDNPDCFEQVRPYAWFGSLYRRSAQSDSSPISLTCYHKTLETQLLTVSHNINAVAVQVLYGCNRFHFSSASLFHKFTDIISPLGVQSLRHLAIDYPLPRSFQVASLRRLVMGTGILDLQALELNMLNVNKGRMNLSGASGRTKSHRYRTERGPSLAASKLIDLLDGLRETQSVGNNEILFAINEKFDVNRADVEQQLLKATDLHGRNAELPEYCKVKLTRKRT